ncbi:MAG: LysM peptidoglycan-binding domain-containing protein [Verrucomicrobiota bacterium]
MIRTFVALFVAGLLSSLTIAQEAPTPAEGEKKPEKPVTAAPPTQAPTDAPPKKSAPPAKPNVQKYVIQSGDNPWLIAKEHGVSLEKLLEVNEIKDPKNLKIGDVIVLPEGTKSKNEPTKPVAEKPKSKEASPKSPPAGAEWEYYTIQRGDNPWTISKKLKRDHQTIMKLNEGMDFRDLKIGQQIKVPKG